MYAHDSIGQEKLIKSRIIQRLNVSDVKINNTKISSDRETITFTFPTAKDCEVFKRCLRNYPSFKLATRTVAPVSQTIALRYDDAFKSALDLLDSSSTSKQRSSSPTTTGTLPATHPSTSTSSSLSPPVIPLSSASAVVKQKRLEKIVSKNLSSQETDSKQPIRINVCYDYPGLFSFPLGATKYLDEAEIKLVKEFSSEFNHFNLFDDSEKNKDASIEQRRILSGLLLRINGEKDKNLVSLTVRINLMLAMLESRLGNERECRNIIEFNIRKIENMQKKTDEIWWYYEHMISTRISSTGKTDGWVLENIRTCIINITSKKHQRYLLAIYTTQYLPALPGFPEEKHLCDLQEVFSKGKISYQSTLDRLRYEYIMKNEVINKHYFSIDDESLWKDTHQINLSLTINKKESFLGGKIKITTEFSRADSFRFCLHILPPGISAMKINFPKLSLAINDKFNHRLLINLQAKKLCNSLGFLNINEIINNKDHLRLSNTFKEIITTTLLEVGINKPDQFSSGDIENNIRIYVNNHFDFQSWRKTLIEIHTRNESLLTFNGIDAILLFYQSFTACRYGLDETLLKKVKQLAVDCLEIAYKARQIKKIIGQDSLVEFDNWFKLAGEVVSNIIQKKRSVIIAVGTPIGEKGTHSAHAIYVAFKYLKNNCLQIIIANGGLYANNFHKLSLKHISGEIEKYHFAAFKPFELKGEYLTALQHYIYNLFCLEYKKSEKTDESKLQTANELMKNHLYLPKSNKEGNRKFTGYKGQVFSIFEREDLKETFFAQFVENCTIHNLICAITISLDMNILQSGLLQNNLILGFDAWLTQYTPQQMYQQALFDSNNNRPNSAYNKAERALRILKAHPDTNTESLCYLLIAKFYESMDDFNLAISAYQNAILPLQVSYPDELKNALEQYSSYIDNLIFKLTPKRLYAHAIELYKKEHYLLAQRMLSKILPLFTCPEEQVTCYSTLISCYRMLNNIPQAIEHVTQALTLCQSHLPIDHKVIISIKRKLSELHNIAEYNDKERISNISFDNTSATKTPAKAALFQPSHVSSSSGSSTSSLGSSLPETKNGPIQGTSANTIAEGTFGGREDKVINDKLCQFLKITEKTKGNQVWVAVGNIPSAYEMLGLLIPITGKQYFSNKLIKIGLVEGVNFVFIEQVEKKAFLLRILNIKHPKLVAEFSSSTTLGSSLSSDSQI